MENQGQIFIRVCEISYRNFREIICLSRSINRYSLSACFKGSIQNRNNTANKQTVKLLYKNRDKRHILHSISRSANRSSFNVRNRYTNILLGKFAPNKNFPAVWAHVLQHVFKTLANRWC
jgi:hypothetical protein